MSTDLDEVLATTRAIRRLDWDRPVDRALVDACLRLARYAPSGMNRQRWRFVAVDDPELRAGIARHYREAFTERYAGTTLDGIAASARTLAESLHRVPVLVLACVAGRPEPSAAPERVSSYYGSIYPAVWSFMLAARARGLGTTLTTVHLARAAAIADLLGLPCDTAQIALIPVGHVRPGAFTTPRRLPLEAVAAWNRWPG
jgi:nitroreductase